MSLFIAMDGTYQLHMNACCALWTEQLLNFKSKKDVTYAGIIRMMCF